MQSEADSHGLVSENVRYLLWKDPTIGAEHRERWAEILAARTGLSIHDAETILEGSREPAEEEIALIETAFGFTARDGGLRYPLPTHEHVLVENVNYLLGTLESGAKTRLADKLGIAKTTISRWKRGSEPRSATLRALVSEFGLERTVDLAKDKIYLSFRPVTIQKRRERLKRLIDGIDGDKLEKVIAAVELMVRDS